MARKILAFCMCIVMVFSLCSCSFTVTDNSLDNLEGELIVHFIDVGQGDSILLESNDSFVLIDAGEVEYGEVVCKYLKSCGVDTLDYIIATHPHSDHCGGLTEVINTFSCKNFITCETDQQTKTWLNVLYAVKDSSANYIDAEVSSTYSFGEASFEILGPYGKSYNDYNDYSVVVKAVCGNTSFLFTGDAESGVEREMISNGADLTADVLKVGHHGSYTSSCTEFLSEVDPTYAVISCGKNNEYGHPHKETMDSLSERNVITYRTDEFGSIIAVSDANTIKFYFPDSDSDTVITDDATDVNSSAVTEAQTDSDDTTTTYIGNKNSKKYHISSCDSVSSMSDKNKVYFVSEQKALESGYTPCQSCDP